MPTRFWPVLASGLLWALTALGQDSGTRSAYQLWIETLESSLTGREEVLKVSGTEGKITYGAEKEGSSGLITRVMGPDETAFQAWLASLSGEERPLFLREFLSSWLQGSIRVRGVQDAEGLNRDFDFSFLKQLDLRTAPAGDLEAAFGKWLDAAGDRSFSFISEGARMRLFKGTFLPGRLLPTLLGKRSSTGYHHWVPLYGQPQRYLQGAHHTLPGWEINFKPQESFAAFETMIDWFRTTLKNAGEEFEAPGHQRMILPRRPDVSPAARAQLESQMGELYRHVQAYILLRGMAGMAGVEFSAYKNIFFDSQFGRVGTGVNTRGIVRLEVDRFVKDSYGLELRSGTKSDPTRRFVELLIGSRYAANDFSGIHRVGDWTLLKADGTGLYPDYGSNAELASRFGVSEATVVAARKNLQEVPVQRRGAPRFIAASYLVPFWKWENAPYLSATKKAHLRELTRTFLESVASWKSPTAADVQKAFATWAKASNLIQDVEAYLRPRAPPARGDALARLFEFKPRVTRPGQVDVNAIDLGIEYSARFPIRLQAASSAMKLADGKFAWIETYYDLTQEERSQLLERFSRTLGQCLNLGQFTAVKRQETGNHGHSFVLVYELKDRQGRLWRVEWDGIGRSYDPSGGVVEGSARGGHIEIVTPKFNPTPAEVTAVFTALAKHNLVAVHMGGGGHINVDLAPFEGKPRALARFLTLFHEHRGIISLMFQHVGRLKSAEPLDLSPALVARLRDFQGTETELKQLLFNERYFNTRVGRKARYLQLDVGAYFQDVIPAGLLTRDFDLLNDPWRQAFQLDPRIRKMEFRLFDAPRNEIEAALQVKLVRALLHQALNESTPLRGTVQKVDHAAYVQDPAGALADLKSLAEGIGLDLEEYHPLVVEGLATTRDEVTSEGHESLSARLARHPQVKEGWGRAVAPRGPEEAIASDDHPWSGQPGRESQAFEAARRQAQAEAERLRLQVQRERAQGPRAGVVSRSDCIDQRLQELLVGLQEP